MKIIEVVLTKEDSDDEEEDTRYKKKHFDVLKQELHLEKTI